MKNIVKKLRKGFTIVELVVVIAVIAILAAVLIPTLSNVINSAKESNDTSLAKNMNTTLSSYGIVNGNPKTAHEALEALEDDGYLLQNMTPTADGYNYVWDKNTNSVALLTNKFEISFSQYDDILTNSKSELWAIVSTQEQVEAFENSGYTFSYCIVSDEELTVNNSFDSYLIENANVTLTSDAASTFTIYTNGGEVAINAENATEIIHNGTVSLVNANAVNTTSYHLYGEAKMLVLKSGRVVVKDGANVSILALNDSGSDTQTIEVEADSVSEAISSVYSTTGTAINITTGSGKNETVTPVKNESLKDGVSGVTYITGSSSDEVTKNFNSFIADGYGIAVLQTNVTTESEIKLTSGKFVMIDLNGFTLTGTSIYSNKVTENSELTISNGTLSFNNMETIATGALIAQSNSKITLNNVKATTNGALLFPYGNAAEVNVINSTLYSTGAYCIATNASDPYDCKINIENSTVQVEEGYCTICINVKVTLNVTNSEIIGGNNQSKGWVMDSTEYGVAAQALLVRAGTVNMTNSSVTLYTDDRANAIVQWASGNGAPFTAIVLGDASTSYTSADVELNMTNCTVKTLAAKGCTLTTARSIYMYGKDESGYKTSLNFDSSTTINGQIIVGGSQDVTNSNTAKYECAVVTINGTSYYPVTTEGKTSGRKYTVSGTSLTEVTD